MNSPRSKLLGLSALLLLALPVVACSAAPSGEPEGSTGEAYSVISPIHFGPTCATPLGVGSWSNSAAFSAQYYNQNEVVGFILGLEWSGCEAPGEYFTSSQEVSFDAMWFTSCPSSILNSASSFPPGVVELASGGCVPAPAAGRTMIGWNFMVSPNIVGKGCANGACSTPPGAPPIY